MKIVMQARPVEKAPRRSQPKILGRQRRKGLSSKRRRKKERKVQEMMKIMSWVWMSIRTTVKNVKRVGTCYCVTPVHCLFTCVVWIPHLMNLLREDGVVLSVKMK